MTLPIPLLANAFGFINYLQNKEILINGWESLWTQVTLFYFWFFLIPILAIIMASLWYSEHKAGLKNIRISPVKNIHFVLTKVFIALVIIAITQVYFILLFFLGGKFICHLEHLDSLKYLTYTGLSIFLSIPILFIFNAIAIKVKSLSIVVLLSVLTSVAGILISTQNVVPILAKSIGLSFLSLELNHSRPINLNSLIVLVAFGVLEIIISLILSDKFLEFEN